MISVIVYFACLTTAKLLIIYNLPNLICICIICLNILQRSIATLKEHPKRAVSPDQRA